MFNSYYVYFIIVVAAASAKSYFLINVHQHRLPTVMRPLDGHNGSRRVESSTTSATSNQETSLFKRATNVLRRYITSQFSERANYNVTIAGLDGSGKTTFLYLLKLGEVVQTTPTMNLNVETIEILTATSRVFKFTGWDVGAGSNDITAATIERHTVGGDAMIWFVDSSNQMRLSESVGEFTSTIRRVNSHRMLRVGTARKDYPILL